MKRTLPLGVGARALNTDSLAGASPENGTPPKASISLSLIAGVRLFGFSDLLFLEELCPPSSSRS